MYKKFFIALIISICTTIAYADCIYDGVSYPEGTQIGPYICSNGKWVRK